MPRSNSEPELAALDLFVSVVRLGSVSKAAAEHHISQPSASARIKTLERQVGLTLLERSPSGSQPTMAGSLVAGWAETVLRAADELSAGVAALKARTSGRLRVVASLTIAEYLLPQRLEQFLRNRETDAISLDVANSTSVLEQIRAGTSDLGFIESPEPTPGLKSEVIAEDRLIAVVGRNHPWARRTSIPLDALATTPMIVREAGSGTRESLIAAFEKLGYEEPTSTLALGSTAAVKAAVINGGPPSVMSELAVASDVDAGSLVVVDIPGLEIRRELRAVWPRQASLPPLAKELLQTFR